MKYLGLNKDELISKGAYHTAKEISNQPLVWKDTYDRLIQNKDDISNFLGKIKGKVNKIILTGAGTSAYIGYSLEGSFQRHMGVVTVSVPTTHIVTHPYDYLQDDVSTLVVSFARSGNSPESVAVLALADDICVECYHLVITCDEGGELAKYKSINRKLNFVLPLESNDKSLAMTSSYTSMLLTGLLISRFEEVEVLKKQVELLVEYGKNVIDNNTNKLDNLSQLNFKRAIFLGSGPLYGTATESHLKLQELTDGQTICKNDTFLGFRHGPKAVVDSETIVFFIFSNNKKTQKYEIDLVKSMQNEGKSMMLIGVSENPIVDINLDVEINLSENNTMITEEFLSVCSVLPAQIIGFFKSLNNGLKPDNPSISGVISRVVKGVTIYND